MTHPLLQESIQSLAYCQRHSSWEKLYHNTETCQKAAVWSSGLTVRVCADGGELDVATLDCGSLIKKISQGTPPSCCMDSSVSEHRRIQFCSWNYCKIYYFALCTIRHSKMPCMCSNFNVLYLLHSFTFRMKWHRADLEPVWFFIIRYSIKENWLWNGQ